MNYFIDNNSDNRVIYMLNGKEQDTLESIFEFLVMKCESSLSKNQKILINKMSRFYCTENED